MNNEIKIAVVDDHAMFRKGLIMLIDLFPLCKVVFDAENGEDFIKKIAHSPEPDIVLMDIHMPIMDGYRTTEWIKLNYPSIKVLTLSTMDAESAIVNMIKSGAKGYVLKDAEPAELKVAFQKLMTKGYYYSDMVNEKVLSSMTAIFKDGSDVFTVLKITDKEVDFLKLVCTDMSYMEISKYLKVSSRTVDGYRDHLFRKIGVTSRVGLVLFSIRNGLFNI